MERVIKKMGLERKEKMESQENQEEMVVYSMEKLWDNLNKKIYN